MIAVIVSLAIGVIIGYMGQRSRMCFIGGIRDYILVRDTFLLKGFIGFLVTAILMFMLLNLLGANFDNYPWYEREIPREYISLADYARETGETYAVCDLPLESISGLIKEPRGVKIGDTIITNVAILTIIGGLSIGFLSTLANGCPFRQHIMASSGNKSAWVYLLGFYFGIIVYQFFIADFINNLTK
ncbi:hypothetical protein GGQ84_002368 [Desulfitispora alkaliphila]|uniref:hypothetical protein n=1 Tax=Desulfitispora alkaliphila TaxID=622674 RepID=UPI003D1D87F9